jgi:hypothetical protein
MTKKELVAKINDLVTLYGVTYKPSMRMLKAELEAMYNEATEVAQQAYNARFNQTTDETQVNMPEETKEETEMKNQTTTLVREFKVNLDGHKKFVNGWTDYQPVTDGQRRFYAAMVRNYIFDESKIPTPKNAKEMSNLLWRMEVAISEGRVQKRDAAEVVESLKNIRKAPVVDKNAITDRQVAYIKKMAHELHRWVDIPKTKAEASELIKELDTEVQKLRFKKAVAVTTDAPKVEATEEAPKLSWFAKVVRFFKGRA